MVRFIFFLLLMQILPTGLKGRNFDPPLLSMIKEAKNTCVVYDFDDNKIRTGNPEWSNEERRIVLQALNNYDFEFDGTKDTLLICMKYVDWLVHVYKKNPLGPKRYCKIPVDIIAYSSREELHLSLGEGEEYCIWDSPTTTNLVAKYTPYGEEGILPDIIKSNDLDTFKAIYDKYHDHALGGGPDHVLRMEVSDNRIVSISEWIFEINGISYSWDQVIKAQGIQNGNDGN